MGALVYEPTLKPDMLKDLNLQETLFLEAALLIAHKQHPLDNYDQNRQVIRNHFLDMVRAQQKIYVLYDARTGYPLLDGSFVLMYLEKEHAEIAAKLYAEQMRSVKIIEVPGMAAEPAQLDGKIQMKIFDYLFFLGAENIVIDNGWYKGIVKRSEISVPMDWNSDPKNTPPSNPALSFAMTDYVSEMRWPVKYEKREEILRKKTDRMMALIPSGRFIIPSRVAEPTPEQIEKLPEGQKAAKQVQFPAVKVNEKMYLPVFTDLFEYSKKFAKTDMRPVGFEYKNLLRFVAGNIEGIIINPSGQGIVVPRDKAQELLLRAAGIRPEQKETSKEGSKEAPAADEDKKD